MEKKSLPRSRRAFFITALALHFAVAACSEKSRQQIEQNDGNEKSLTQAGEGTSDEQLKAEEKPAPEEEAAAEPAASDAETSPEKASPPEPVFRQPADFLAGHSQQMQFIRAFSDGFESLPPRKRLLALQLVRAVLAGRDIVYDQLHEDNLAVRRLLENIAEHSVDTALKLKEDILNYLRLVWINSGVFDAATFEKLSPSFDYSGLQAAAASANALGAELAPAENDESVEQMLARLKSLIFDSDYHPVLASARLHLGEDPLQFSWLNIYSNVRLRQLAGFQEQYPLNSRLVLVDDKVVEDVYRSGDKLRKIPRGRYFKNLWRINQYLEEAMVAAGKKTRQAIGELIEFFTSGSIDNFQRACLVLGELDEDVVFSLGFSDLSLDPRRSKGIMEGFVAVRDAGSSQRIFSLLNGKEKILDALDWPEEWKNRSVSTPRVAAAELLAGIGRQGPCSERSAKICGEALGETLPPARVIFSNLTQARGQVSWRLISSAWPALFSDGDTTSLNDLAFTHEVLRSAVAPELGVRPKKFHQQLWPYDLVLLRLQQEAAGLWLIDHPLLEEMGWIPNEQQRQRLLRLVMVEYLVEQALAGRQTLRAPAPLAKRILVRYLVEDAKVLEVKIGGNQVQFAFAPPEKWREALGKLLKRTQRILFTANRLSAQRLVEKFSSPLTAPWQEALSNNAVQAGLYKRRIWVMPHLRAIQSEGRANDASLSHDETFDKQMMRYSRF